ncbi:MAG: citrate/2-methylcitrate synthase [Alphaproteobacteria bacterium]|nr:citrate/2-methylcitrate synthase [Alphaproteobacteria bacterium]
MRFIAFLLFLIIQIVHASGPEVDVTVKGVRLSDGRIFINTDDPSCDGLLLATNGMRKVAFNVSLTTCPVDTPEGGVLRIRGGKTLNDVLGGFPVGSKPAFEGLDPMPYENLFGLLLIGSETISAEVNTNIFAGIERAKRYLRTLSRQEGRCPIRFFRNALEDCLADEFDGIAPKDQLQQLAEVGPQIIGIATTLAAYLNHLSRGKAFETFKTPETYDGLVRCFMKMALPAEYQADEGFPTILNTYFDLLIGHGMNLSTSILIQTASGSGDVANVILAALNALDTDNHGKAALKTHDMFAYIKSNYGGDVARFIDAVVKKEETLWGHGHAIYKKGTDPRAEVMEVLAKKVREITTDRDLQYDIDLALALKAEASAKGLPYQTNVDYFASLILRGCGIDPKLSTVMFAASRMGSWIADLYQFEKGKHPLMRPQDYPAEMNSLLQAE